MPTFPSFARHHRALPRRRHTYFPNGNATIHASILSICSSSFERESSSTSNVETGKRLRRKMIKYFIVMTSWANKLEMRQPSIINLTAIGAPTNQLL